MTHVEKLEAAIAKLEGLVADVRFQQTSPDYPVYFTSPNATDAAIQLSLTLHRTIAAQVQILRTVLAAHYIEQNWATLVYTESALALADAILNEES